MASTMVDVPALDVLNFTLAVSAGSLIPMPAICAGSENKSCS